MLAGILLGVETGIPEEVQQAFRDTDKLVLDFTLLDIQDISRNGHHIPMNIRPYS